MANGPVGVEVTQEGLRSLLRALRSEADGKDLRKELRKELKDVLKPRADRAKNGALAIPSQGAGTSPALRPAIARGIQPRIDLALRNPGASIRAKRTPRIRGFANAPKRTNSRKGWRTQSWGNDEWRVQFGKIGWFDNALQGVGPEAREAVAKVINDMAERIANRVRE